MSKPVDIAGKRFGRLIPICRTDKRNSSGSIVWKCKCECGNTTYVAASTLISGGTKSCGCNSNFGDDEVSRRLSAKLSGMKERCYNPSNSAYSDYGGRGIYICDEWLDDKWKFINWSKANGYRLGLEIDRWPDNNGPYAPWNCRYTTPHNQNRNKRSNHLITVNGETHIVSDWINLLPNKKDKIKLANMLGSHKRSERIIHDWIYNKIFGGKSIDVRKRKHLFIDENSYMRNSTHTSLIGLRFTKLVVVREYKHPDRSGRIRSYCDCVCDCGNKLTVIRDSLISGNTKSCGCIKSLKTKETFRMKRLIFDEEKTKGRIKYLEKLISACNEGYWERSENIVSDPEYDKLVEELKQLDPTNPLVTRLTSDHIPGEKVKHKEHMYSLDKVYSWDDLVKWCESVARSEDELFNFSCKYDGLSVEFYNNRLVTRGDGDVGTDITHLAPWIKCRLKWHPETLESMFMTIIKNNDGRHGTFGRMIGELLVPRDTFERLRNTYGCLYEYKTPRNMAAGFANLKPDSEVLKQLIYAGLPIPVCTWVHHRAHELTYPLKALRSKEAEIVKKLKNYKKCPCDGIVCRLEDEYYGDTLGVTQHHPKSAVALKFKDEEYTSIVRDIEWSVGHDAITPVAIFDPIQIDDVEIERATCHNVEFVVDNNIHPGVTVTIVRRGGVIPKVVAVDSSSALGVHEIPKVCPSCGQETSIVGKDLVCTNSSCVGRCVSKIVDGLHTLGMNGFGPALVEKMVRELYIPNIMVLALESWDEKILLQKGFTATEIRRITTEFERVFQKGVDDAVLFSSLCIPQARETFAEKVIKYTGTIMSLIDDTPSAVYEKLSKIPGINTTALRNAVNFLIETDSAGLFDSYWNLFQHKRPVDVDKLDKYCFTGALPIRRKDLEEFVLSHGAYPTDNIRQANFLVSADPTSTSEKMQYARKNNIPVINFDELKAKLSK